MNRRTFLTGVVVLTVVIVIVVQYVVVVAVVPRRSPKHTCAKRRGTLQGADTRGSAS